MSKRFKSLVILVLAIVLCMSMSMNAFAASKTTSGGSSGSVTVQFTASAYTTGSDYVSISQKITTSSSLLINMYWDKLVVINNSGNSITYTNLGSATAVNSYSTYKALSGSAGSNLSGASTQRAYSSAFGTATAVLSVAW